MEIGDSTSACTYEVTAEAIADFCRAARYENLAYTNQPAAREMGLPGIVAPPAMVLVYAPLRLAELLAVNGSNVTTNVQDAQEVLTITNVTVKSCGVMVEPGDVITSVTSVVDKSQARDGQLLTLQVTGRNQRGELVADYTCTYRWPGDVR